MAYARAFTSDSNSGVIPAGFWLRNTRPPAGVDSTRSDPTKSGATAGERLGRRDRLVVAVLALDVGADARLATGGAFCGGATFVAATRMSCGGNGEVSGVASV